MGSQCRSFRVEVTWSRGPRRTTGRAAAFWTRCNGAIVNLGRLAAEVQSTEHKRGDEFSRIIQSKKFPYLLQPSNVVETGSRDWWRGSASTIRCPEWLQDHVYGVDTLNDVSHGSTVADDGPVETAGFWRFVRGRNQINSVLCGFPCSRLDDRPPLTDIGNRQLTVLH